MSLKKQILDALGIDNEVKLEYQAKLTDVTIIVSSADELEAGVDISVLTEDGTTMPLPAGEYETEDGVGFSVVDEGIIAEMYEEEAEGEEAPAEETEEVEAKEENRTPKKVKETKEMEFNKEELLSEVTSIVKDLISNAISDFRKEIAEIKDNAEAEVEKLSKEPADNPIATKKFSKNTNRLKATPTELRRMSPQERFLYELNK